MSAGSLASAAYSSMSRSGIRVPRAMRSSSRCSDSEVTGVAHSFSSPAVCLRYVRTFRSSISRGTASSNGLVAPIWCE